MNDCAETFSDAPGLVRYYGREAVAQARARRSTLEFTYTNHDVADGRRAAPEAAERYLARGGEPDEVQFTCGIDAQAEEDHALRVLKNFSGRQGDDVWLHEAELNSDLSMDRFLGAVERLVAKNVFEYVGCDRGIRATVSSVDPGEVPPTRADIPDGLHHRRGAPGVRDDTGFRARTKLGRLLQALIALGRSSQPRDR